MTIHYRDRINGAVLWTTSLATERSGRFGTVLSRTARASATRTYCAGELLDDDNDIISGCLRFEEAEEIFGDVVDGGSVQLCGRRCEFLEAYVERFASPFDQSVSVENKDVGVVDVDHRVHSWYPGADGQQRASGAIKPSRDRCPRRLPGHPARDVEHPYKCRYGAFDGGRGSSMRG